jgi:hypothetical protein
MMLLMMMMMLLTPVAWFTKADVVRLIKTHTGLNTCAIGDGGNDVSMIQAADVGVGIVGKEGQQASMAADVSVEQFSYIAQLLLWHGRNSYQRSAHLCQVCASLSLCPSLSLSLSLFRCVCVCVCVCVFECVRETYFVYLWLGDLHTVHHPSWFDHLVHSSRLLGNLLYGCHCCVHRLADGGLQYVVHHGSGICIGSRRGRQEIRCLHVPRVVQGAAERPCTQHQDLLLVDAAVGVPGGSDHGALDSTVRIALDEHCIDHIHGIDSVRAAECGIHDSHMESVDCAGRDCDIRIVLCVNVAVTIVLWYAAEQEHKSRTHLLTHAYMCLVDRFAIHFDVRFLVASGGRDHGKLRTGVHGQDHSSQIEPTSMDQAAWLGIAAAAATTHQLSRT